MMNNTMGISGGGGVEESKNDPNQSDFLAGLGIMKNHSNTMFT
jgi:hypothetical protein